MKLNFDQFSDLIWFLDPKMDQWKIIAVFEQASGKKEVFDGVTIFFDDFMACALNNDLMKKLMDNYNERMREKEMADNSEGEIEVEDYIK